MTYVVHHLYSTFKYIQLKIAFKEVVSLSAMCACMFLGRSLAPGKVT
jgi:hypothetical protein